MAGISDIVSGIVGGAGDFAIKLRTALTGVDPIKAAEIQTLALNLDAQIRSGQNAINQVEAASTNLFVSGWRPFIGWICGIAIGYNFLVIPFAGLFLKIFKADFTMPALDMGELWTLVTGMLGLGTMRTVEKLQGAQGNH
jgi:roadblock/LC7 domain-containing protein